MSEPVLERSVLERKERDELQTIAKALGAQPPSRMKKADLVDLVLRTAGIIGDAVTADDSPGDAPSAQPSTAAPVGARVAPGDQGVDGGGVAAGAGREPTGGRTGPGASREGGGPDGGGRLASDDRGAGPGGGSGPGDGGADEDGASSGAPVAADGGGAGTATDAADTAREGADERVVGRVARASADGGGSRTGPAGREQAERPRAQPGADRTRPERTMPARLRTDQPDEDGSDSPGDRAQPDRAPGHRVQPGRAPGDRGQGDPPPSVDRPDDRPGAGGRLQGDRPGSDDRPGAGGRLQGDRVQGDPPPSVDRPGPADRPAGGRSQGDRPGSADRVQGDRPDRGRGERVPDDQGDMARAGERVDANGRPPVGQVAAATGPQGNGQNEDGEGGNRRRRRRNRDRVDGQVDRPETAGDESFTGEPVECAGLLDLRDEGYGFLRVKGYLPHRDDVYVSVRQVRQLGLRKGDHLAGASRPANRQEKNPALLRIDSVNGQDPDAARRRPRFEDLTPLFPDEKLKLEMPTDPSNMTARIVDLVAPIGKGQRGLIVSPPKAGKTTILKQIVRSIERNDPDVHLMVLLVDERPEEVTDMRRSTSGEVIASTFDRPADEHTAVSELVLERAKRLVEEGRDVVIVLDGITRLARAYNLAAPATGRIMSGGIDTGALYPPKKFFGAARNIEEGGSLTILATALIETGSKMDEVIFEEFKGTGNMELRLDRRLAERRIYPAIDVDGSSTRHEELLFNRQQLQQVWRVRRALHALSTDAGSPAAALERLMDGMKTFKTNDEFLAEAAKAGGPAA